MQDETVKGSAKESPRKVDARDSNSPNSDLPRKTPQGQPGASLSSKQQRGGKDEPLSDPPLRKGLHESVPRAPSCSPKNAPAAPSD
jgi:hypothetical protein